MSINTKSYTSNHGKAGVVYILRNSALKNGLYKIGQSTRSGKIRAFELNSQAATGMPAEYKCIFEYKTIDCGRAEEEAHRILHHYKRGKWGQEFFEVDIRFAIKILKQVCNRYNERYQNIINNSEQIIARVNNVNNNLELIEKHTINNISCRQNTTPIQLKSNLNYKNAIFSKILSIKYIFYILIAAVILYLYIKAKFNDKLIHHINKKASVDCTIKAAKRHNIPAHILLAIGSIENGENGKIYTKIDGSYDIGHMKINSIVYTNELKQYGLTIQDIQWDGCKNVEATAFLIKKLLENNDLKQDYWAKISNYHSSNYTKNLAYKKKLKLLSKQWDKWIKSNLQYNKSKL